LHVDVHAAFEHDGWEWAMVVVHAFPQAPQLLTLLAVSTHVMPHDVGVVARHPAVQA
jgi:hypothetical protein